jgi:hypothetical protein
LTKTPPEFIDEYVAAWRVVQRFWLTATKGMQEQDKRLCLDRNSLIVDKRILGAVFMGQIGTGQGHISVLLRLPLDGRTLKPE